MGNRSLDDFLDEDAGAETDESGATAEEGEPGATEDGDGPAETEEANGFAETEEGDESADTDEAAEIEAADGADRDAPESGGSTDGESAGDDARVDPTTVEPADTTYAWGGDESVCQSCGESVDRRWRSDDGLVCPDCKEW